VFRATGAAQLTLTMRVFPSAIVALTGLVLSAAPGQSPGPSPVQVTVETRPNFILFLVDDVSWDDLGCYGHPTLETPCLDALAAGGLRFTQAYLQASSCSPSRCSIITGRYPHNTGAPELHTALPEGQVLFPELLREAGYHTVLSGKNHMGPAVGRAFTKISKGKGPGKERDWVELVRERPRDKPFFFWFASTDAHRSWQFDDDARTYEPSEVVVPPYLVDAPATRSDLTGYYHEVSRFDAFVGRVTAELKEQGALANTVLVFIADNGRPFPRCKTRLYDSGIKTPLIIHWPARVKPGVTSSFAAAIDLSATFLDLAGIEPEERIQGVSLAPVLEDPSAVVRDVVFAEHNWHVFQNHERMVRFGDWLYIRNNIPDQANLCLEALEDGAGEDLWHAHAAGELGELQQQVVREQCPAEELFHVGDDPLQLTNVAGRTENAAVMTVLRSLLDEWTERTGDDVPDDLTPDRQPRPGAADAATRGKRPLKRGAMPGAAHGAETIVDPGPVRTELAHG